MKKQKIKFPYQITCSWSEEDGEFLARVPAIRHCIAYGSTVERAVKEVRIVAEAMLESLEAHGKPIPVPDTALERLKALAPVLKMAAIAKMAGMSAQTLASKMQRGTPLTEDEERRLGSVLQAHGVAVS
jgi:predicted RNase H-like HicB family nuclease